LVEAEFAVRQRIFELWKELTIHHVDLTAAQVRLEYRDQYMDRARTLYESPYLTVTGASATHLLAMKLLAARDADRQDIATLVDHLEIEEPEQAIRIFDDLFPEERLKAEARDILTWACRRRRPPG
jgi:phosphoglycolate phosphatase-like HAD superfamily hydrolase